MHTSERMRLLDEAQRHIGMARGDWDATSMPQLRYVQHNLELAAIAAKDVARLASGGAWTPEDSQFRNALQDLKADVSHLQLLVDGAAGFLRKLLANQDGYLGYNANGGAQGEHAVVRTVGLQG